MNLLMQIYCLLKFILEYIPKYVLRQNRNQQVFVRLVSRPLKTPCLYSGTSGVRDSRTTACEGISCVYGLAFPPISHTEKWWSPVSDNDRVCVSLSPCRGDYPVITFWGRLQPATIPSNLTGWLWTACDRMDCFLSPRSKNGSESSMWMRRGSSGCRLQVHIHCFHITGCGRVIAANGATTISSGCHRYAGKHRNSENVVELTVTADRTIAAM